MTWAMPKSLFGRALLIIMLPIAAMQLIVTYAFFTAHWSMVTATLSESVAGEIAVVTDLFAQDPTVEYAKTLDAVLREDIELSVVLQPGQVLPTFTRRNLFSRLDQGLSDALSRRVDAPIWYDTTRYPNHVDIRVQTDQGVLRFIAARERVFAPTGLMFIFWLITTTAALSLISVYFLRNQVRPLSELADAAERYGLGQPIDDYEPYGASEVRRAGTSFLRMRSRLTRSIEQRTLMLAGVSHDLRTPLTRLQLHLAMQPKTAEAIAARADLAEMEAMLDGYLDFARGDVAEASEPTDMVGLLDAVAQMHGIDPPDIEGPSSLMVRPLAIRRVIDNLVGNARKYAKTVELSLKRDADALVVRVDDDGPGIPKDQRPLAFRPFQRLDVARNQNIEGTGLGLSVARDIARTHGGTLTLADSPLGGLRAELKLPTA